MLHLTCKPGSVIMIGDNIKITVVKTGMKTGKTQRTKEPFVSIGITAPREIEIIRSELLTKKPNSGAPPTVGGF